MKKLCVAVVLLVLTAFSVKQASAVEMSNITNLQFAEYLAGQLNIAIPPANKDLPPDQYFNTLANSLSAAGINYFMNASYDADVNFGELADVLFAVVKGTGNLDTAGKIDYLVNNGYLVEKSSPGSKVTMAELRQIFADPKLSGLVAQTYVAPAAPAAGAPGSGAPGATPELPASQI